MAITLIITDRDVQPLRASLKELLPDNTPVWIYPEIPNPQKVEMVVLWKHPAGCLKAFPNLKLISSLGAGVEHIFQDPAFPANVPVTRIVDDSLVVSMRNYVLMCVLNIQKRTAFCRTNQQQHLWEKPDPGRAAITHWRFGFGCSGRARSHLSWPTLDLKCMGLAGAPNKLIG